MSRCGRAGVGVPFLPLSPCVQHHPSPLLRPLVPPGVCGLRFLLLPSELRALVGAATHPPSVLPALCRRCPLSPPLCLTVSIPRTVLFRESGRKQRCSTYHFIQNCIAVFIMCFGIHRAEPSCSVMSDPCESIDCSPPLFSVCVSGKAGGFCTTEPPEKPEKFLDCGFLSK